MFGSEFWFGANQDTRQWTQGVIRTNYSALTGDAAYPRSRTQNGNGVILGSINEGWATGWSYFYFCYFKAPVAGSYTFYLGSDDGSYAYIGANAFDANGLPATMTINNGGDHSFNTLSTTMTLEAGYHPIYVYGYNSGGGGSITFSWSGPGISTTSDGTNYLFIPRIVPDSDTSIAAGLYMRRYNVNYNVTDSLDAATEVGAVTTLDVNGQGGDGFTLDLTGYLYAPIAGVYTANINADDHVWVWIGSNAMSPTKSNYAGVAHGSGVVSVPLNLNAGLNPFRIRFADDGGSEWFGCTFMGPTTVYWCHSANGKGMSPAPVTPTFPTNNGSYRYYRVRGTGINFSTLPQDQNYWRLYEMGFWTGYDGTGTNLALTSSGSTAVATDVFGQAATAAFDGNGSVGSTIAVASAQGGWMGVDLGPSRVTSIGSFTITVTDIPEWTPQSLVLEGSQDGTNWTTLQGYYVSAKPSSGQTLTFNYTPGQGYRYWKIRPTAAMWDGSNDWRTYELKLYLSADCTGTNVALSSLGSIAMGPGTAAGLASLNDGGWAGSFASSGFNGDPGVGGGYFMIDLGVGREAYIKSLEFSTSNYDPTRYPQKVVIEKTKDGGNYYGNYGEYATTSGLAAGSIIQIKNIPSPNTGIPSV